MRKKILCVDDNVTNIAIFEELLGDDYDLKTASSGTEALHIASQFHPELILLDIMMPGIDGYEVCRRLRSFKMHNHLKIIMVSAKAMLSERLKGYEVGADDYIVKPFSEDELLAKTRVYLRLKTVEETDNFKTEILKLLSHKTRTPLHEIITPARILTSDKEICFETRRECGKKIYSTAVHLLEYIDKVLMLNGIKAGTLKFEYKRTYLQNVVQNAISDVTAIATEKNIKIDVNISKTDSLFIDHKLLKFVITTLLENSIRFSPEGGFVTINIFSEDEHVSLSVVDKGEGIDSSYLPFVFDEMYSSDALHHSERHGLSLSIAQKIMFQHDGTINVISTKGQGTTFTIQLPVKQLASVSSRTSD